MQVDENTFRQMMKDRARIALLQHPFRSLAVGLFTFLPVGLMGLVIRALGSQDGVSGKVLALELLGVAVLYYLLLPPLQMGKMRYLGMASRGQEPGLGELAYYSESLRAYGQSIKLLLAVDACTLCWAILFCLPAGVYGFYLMGLAELTRRQIYILVFLSVTGSMLTAIKRQTYWGAMVLAAGNPQIRPLAALQSSRLLFRGKWQLQCRFYISFLFWIVLSLISGGLCTVLYDLYYTMSYSMMVDSLCVSMVIQNKKAQEKDSPAETTNDKINQSDRKDD